MSEKTTCVHGIDQSKEVVCIRCIEARIQENVTTENNLRGRIGLAICERFNVTYEEHGIDYDPDTCWEAADDVIAVLIHQLTSQMVESEPSNVIGSKVFKLGRQKY